MAKQIFEGKRVVVLERDGWEYVERKKATEAVAVIALTNGDEVILTEQYRRPVDARVIDWPAGLVGDDGVKDPAATAKKELEEETGYRCERVERLAGGPSSPGITSEIVSLYRAYGVTRVGEGGGVGNEKITVHLVPLADVVRWLHDREREGMLVDLKLWSGLHFVTKSA
jgi:ADP-ribose pyrophosphatase